MPLVKRLDEDTIKKLAEAAQARFREAEVLVYKGKLTGAVYLFGYVGEMVLGCSYMRFQAKFQKQGDEEPITGEDLKNMLKQARFALETSGVEQWERFKCVWPSETKKRLEQFDHSHPIFGLALLLQALISHRGLSADRKTVSKNVVEKAAAIRRNWEPKLRYRTNEPTKQELEEVRAAARWFLTNFNKMR